MRLISHEGDYVICEEGGCPCTLHRRVRHYFREKNLLVDEEIQTWRTDDFQSVRISRLLLKLNGWIIRPWEISSP